MTDSAYGLTLWYSVKLHATRLRALAPMMQSKCFSHLVVLEGIFDRPIGLLPLQDARDPIRCGHLRLMLG